MYICTIYEPVFEKTNNLVHVHVVCLYAEVLKKLKPIPLCVFRRNKVHQQKHVHEKYMYEGGSESSVIGVITLLIDMIGCCFIP